MRIGGEYLSEKMSLKNFELLAEESGLSKPMVRQRVGDLIRLILREVEKSESSNPIIKAVTQTIQLSCVNAAGKLR